MGQETLTPQQERFAAMRPAEKLEQMQKLWEAARELKRAALRSQHPDWSVERIATELRRIFLYARS